MLSASIPAGEQGRYRRHSLYFLYHALVQGSSDYPYAIAVERFEKQVALFAEVRKSSADYCWPELTFDDGHISSLQLALPILQAYDLAALFFITVGWTGWKPAYLGWSDLRLLQENGQQIGAHGWSHMFLTRCKNDELQRELLSARLMLEDKLGMEINTMSLPGGRFNRRVIAAAYEAGYRRVYTSVPEPEKLSSSFLVGRINVREEMTMQNIRHFLRPKSREVQKLKRNYYAKAVLKRLLTDRLYDNIWSRLNKTAPGLGAATETDEDSAHYQ